MAGMPSGIDHLVIAVPDPDAAAAELAEVVGLAFTGGGRHEGLGTFNRIAFLGDAYLELMGVDDPEAARAWAIGQAAMAALASAGGFATYGLLDQGIQITVARLQANGSSIGPVMHGSRQRSDGEVVEWWSAAPAELGPARPPFLIRHAAYGAEWGAAALAARRAYVHPIGSPIRVDGLEVALRDPIELASECAAEVGVEFAWQGEAAVTSIGPQTIRLVRGTSSPVEATLFLGAGVDRPRRVRALGMVFVMRPATLVGHRA
jgi:catechol 2,3-dioxygenase-like lactoylglutathione lyase family enzyme